MGDIPCDDKKRTGRIKPEDMKCEHNNKLEL